MKGPSRKILKKIGSYIIIGVFWIGVAVTLIGSCGGLVHSIFNSQEESAEEHILDKVP